MVDDIPHDHGSTGEQPPSGLDFANGVFPDPEVFDWFWNQTTTAINDHATRLEALDPDGNGTVTTAETADSAKTYKGNDIDTDGDGKVNAADVADVADQAARFETRADDPQSPDDGQVWVRTDL